MERAGDQLWVAPAHMGVLGELCVRRVRWREIKC